MISVFARFEEAPDLLGMDLDEMPRRESQLVDEHRPKGRNLPVYLKDEMLVEILV